MCACRHQGFVAHRPPVVTPYIYTHIHLVSIVPIGSDFCASVRVRGSAVVVALLLLLFGYSSVQDPLWSGLVLNARA